MQLHIVPSHLGQKGQLRSDAFGNKVSLQSPRAGGATAYKGVSSGWPMQKAFCEMTLKGCAE